jgi:paraquat-inducible protein B
MNKRVSPTAIGAFVVASLAVLIVAIIVIGSGRMFRKPLRYICMFAGDLNGLKVGAPVKIRGVQVGSVAAIHLGLAPDEGRIRPNFKELRLPVVIELDKSQFIKRGGSGAALGGSGYAAILNRGLRAQLRTESLLTGLLYVDLDLHPGTREDLVIEPGSGSIPEIPTIPTSLAKVQEQATQALAKFDQIDFKALVTSITTAANSINSLANSPSLKATLASLPETTANLNKTVVSVRVAVDTANSKLGSLIANLQNNSAEVNSTLKETRATLTDLQETLDPDSPLAVHLDQALDQLTATAASIGDLSDYLQRNPSSIVRGRYVPAKDQ